MNYNSITFIRYIVASAVVILFLTLIACSVAGGKLSKEQLAAILWEINKEEEAISYAASLERWDTVMIAQKQEMAMLNIMKQYNTTQDQVILSLNHFKENPLEFESLLNLVKQIGDSASLKKQPNQPLP